MFYTSIHKINTAAFMTDIITSDVVTHPKEHVSDLYKLYRQIRKVLLDKHASMKSKSVSHKPPTLRFILRQVTLHTAMPSI